jgi:hypothetical protein
MTRQPAIQLGIISLMTVDAKAHFEIHRHQAVRLLDISMACGAIDPRFDVRLMVELHVVGNVKNPHPRDRRFRIQAPSLFHDLGMLGNNVLVAEKAFAYLRNPRMVRPLHKRVTEATVDFFHPRMDSVAKINGLLRPQISLRIEVIEI